MTDLKDKIHVIRDKQVLLDSDVAELYHYETKRINETVKRNITRFSEEFCFQLTIDEYQTIFKLQNKSLNNDLTWSQIATTSTNKYRRATNIPYVFTEKGVIMLAGLLKSDIAIDASVRIVEAFVEMKRFITNNADIFKRLTTVEYKLIEHDDKFNTILAKLEEKPDVKERLFYDGEIYDAYSLIVNILKEAKKEIVIIDNYIDKRILDILTFKRKDVDVFIFTNNLKLNDLDMDKFISQYGEVKVAYTNRFHDRFIIIDGKVLYHIGASLKDLGKKCFGITKIEDKEYLERLNKIIDEHHFFC